MTDKTNSVLVFERKPQGFTPKIAISGVYLTVGNTILLLQYAEGKKTASYWGVPAGKLEAKELPKEGAKRELFEETSIVLDPSTPLHFLGQLYIRSPEVDYIYYAFWASLPRLPEVQLSKEHMAYTWVSVEEAKQLPLISGGDVALKFYTRLCPCHSKKLYRECCLPFHSQTALPQTAELLMRSRYSAYACSLSDYIIATTHPSNSIFKKTADKRAQEICEFCSTTEFVDLKIVASSQKASTAEVIFQAFLTQSGNDVSFQETSHFQKVGDTWLYERGLAYTSLLKSNS